MKKELKHQKTKNGSLDLRLDAEELLSSEMFEIKGGTGNPVVCIHCDTTCMVCTGCIAISWS